MVDVACCPPGLKIMFLITGLLWHCGARSYFKAVGDGLAMTVPGDTKLDFPKQTTLNLHVYVVFQWDRTMPLDILLAFSDVFRASPGDKFSRENESMIPPGVSKRGLQPALGRSDRTQHSYWWSCVCI